MKIKFKIISILLIVFYSNYNYAQKAEKQAVISVVNKLFEAMKNGDSTNARSVFHPKATLHSMGFSDKTSQNYFHYESRLEGFFKSIGTPHAEIWDERPGKYEVKIDQQMAQVWVPYSFYLGKTFSHCGIDNITLYNQNYGVPNTKSDWKIIYLVDTMRKDNCLK